MIQRNQKKSPTKILVVAGVIGGLYATLTLMIYPLSYGPIQIRFSEALTILPLYCPQAVIGLSIGCMVANFFGNGVLDVIFGTIATLVAGLMTMLCRRIRSTKLKIVLGIIPPIVINALIVPLTFLTVTELKSVYLINVASVGAGQMVALVGLGLPLAMLIEKSASLKKILCEQNCE